MKEMADGTIRVQIDIDPRCRSDFLTLFPNIDMPVAIAPLVPDFERGMVEEKPESEHKERASGLWMLAVQWCKESEFWKWLEETEAGYLVRCEDDATVALKEICGIDSRRELNTDKAAIAAFNQCIRGPYMAWMERKV